MISLKVMGSYYGISYNMAKHSMVCVSYLSESYTIQDGLVDIEDVGFLVQNNEKTINGLHGCNIKDIIL